MASYYEMLGVSPQATAKEIKQAYWALAKKYHPDHNNDTEEQFKQINEAYAVLSNDDKKAYYDQNLLSKKVHEWFYSTASHRLEKDVHVSYYATPEQLFADDYISIEYQRHISCTDSTIMGYHTEDVVAQVKLPKYSLGKKIRIAKKGHHYDLSESPGDVFVHIKADILQLESNFYIKDGDLYYKLAIDPVMAIVGWNIELIHVDGQSLSIHIPAGTSLGDRIIIPNRGLYHNIEQRGNLIVQITDFVMPKGITAQQSELLYKYLYSGVENIYSSAHQTQGDQNMTMIRKGVTGNISEYTEKQKKKNKGDQTMAPDAVDVTEDKFEEEDEGEQETFDSSDGDGE